MTSQTQIKNKYDIQNINAELLDCVKKILKKDYQGKELITKDIFRWIIRIIISVSILYSYFHSLPFPLDKSLILIASSVYLVFEII